MVSIWFTQHLMLLLLNMLPLVALRVPCAGFCKYGGFIKIKVHRINCFSEETFVTIFHFGLQPLLIISSVAELHQMVKSNQKCFPFPGTQLLRHVNCHSLQQLGKTALINKKVGETPLFRLPWSSKHLKSHSGSRDQRRGLSYPQNYNFRCDSS